MISIPYTFIYIHTYCDVSSDSGMGVVVYGGGVLRKWPSVMIQYKNVTDYMYVHIYTYSTHICIYKCPCYTYILSFEMSMSHVIHIYIYVYMLHIM